MIDNIRLDSRSRSISVASMVGSKDPTLSVRNSSWWSCYVNMTNTCCGAGVLSLPYAFASTGWVMGIFMLLFGAIFSTTAMHLLTLVIAKVGTPTSYARVIMPLGMGTVNASDLLLILYTFGTSCAFLIIIADLMPDACDQMGCPEEMKSRYVWVLGGFACVIPLSFPHNLDFLKHTSGLAVAFLAFIMFVVFVYALPEEATGLDACAHLEDDSSCRGDQIIADGIDTLSFLRVMPIFIFGFGCQITTFPIANEMENPSVWRLLTVWIAAIASASVLYFTVAVCGYATYGDVSTSDLLVHYPKVGLLSATRCMISVVVALSYPLQINPSRRSFLTFVSENFDSDEEISASVLRMRYYSFTVIFLGLSLAIALTVEDLGVVVALVGATGATAVMFIIPGYMFLYYFPKEYFDGYDGYGNALDGDDRDGKLEGLLSPDESITAVIRAGGDGGSGGQSARHIYGVQIPLNPEDVPKWMRTLAWVQLIVGIFIMPVSLAAIFI